MKTFVVIDVYIMMCHLLLTCFNPMSPLLMHDPIPFGIPCPPKEERIPIMIDSKSYHVRKLLRQAFCKRFYDGYHHIKAIKYSNLFYHACMINGEAVGYLNCSSFLLMISSSHISLIWRSCYSLVFKTVNSLIT